MIRRRTLLAGTAAAAAATTLPAPFVRAQARQRMVIATGVDPSFSAYYVAKEGGFFERNGLDVQVNTGPSGSAMVAFLVGNQVNSAYGAEQAGVSAHNVDNNVVVVAEGVTLLRWLAVVGRNVENMAALKGKRVGVARGTGSETFWLAVVAAQRLNPADYTIVNVEAPEMVAALERGNIDAFVAWEPWPSRSVRAVRGSKIILANQDVGILIRNFIYMNRGWIGQNEDASKRFMTALVQATDYMKSNVDESAAHVARFLRQDRDFVKELMGKVEFTMHLTDDSLGNVQLAIDQLRGMNRLTKEVDWNRYVYPDLLRSVAPNRVRISGLPPRRG
ncbi:MAG: NrtA/SsuA/CpmA family ABC transporter substrate-binding protein [Alphaproteobacteria bacterium]|nr:NrtA/SsuA/CpmA family ABC transporter substrate-binding protein [Alphaproteobacteria bacterium]